MKKETWTRNFITKTIIKLRGKDRVVYEAWDETEAECLGMFFFRGQAEQHLLRYAKRLDKNI